MRHTTVHEQVQRRVSSRPQRPISRKPRHQFPEGDKRAVEDMTHDYAGHANQAAEEIRMPSNWPIAYLLAGVMAFVIGVIWGNPTMHALTKAAWENRQDLAGLKTPASDHVIAKAPTVKEPWCLEHEVSSGQTMGSIAAFHGVDERSLRSYNTRLDNPGRIRPGWAVCVPLLLTQEQVAARRAAGETLTQAFRNFGK